MEPTSFMVLILSTAAVAFVHALAPDHWVPFVSIGQAKGWSRSKLVYITTVSGIGHVGSSLAIGALGLFLGFQLSILDAFESKRAEVAGLLLIGFGLAYALWGIKHAREHRHVPVDSAKQVTTWTLVAIFVLGPCEPLIPLLFVSAAESWTALIAVSLVFSVITVVMMVGQVLLAHSGLKLFSKLQINHHHGHTAAGLIVAASGALVMFLGI